MDEARQDRRSPGTDDQDAPNSAIGIVASHNAIDELSGGQAIAPTTTASLSCLTDNLTLSDVMSPQ